MTNAFSVNILKTNYHILVYYKWIRTLKQETHEIYGSISYDEISSILYLVFLPLGEKVLIFFKDYSQTI